MTQASPTRTPATVVALAWIVVILPILWALWQTLLKVVQLFG